MKMNKLVAIALLVSSASYGQSLQNAIKSTDNELYTQANAEFRKLIAAEPANPCYFYHLGENFFAQNEIDSALVYYNQAASKFIEKDKNTALALVAAGKEAWLKGNKTGAKESFTSALTLTKSKDADIIRNIAKVYIKSSEKSLDEAIVLLELAIKLDANNEDGHILMGDALLEKSSDNASAAIKSYNKVIDINPKSARGIVRVGILYARVQNFSEANKKYEEAIAIDPTYAPAYRENAEMLLNLNKAKKAVENWKKYLELNNSLEARYRFATALFSGKQFCDVITEIESLKKDFNNFYMERMLTYSYAECSTDKEAAMKGIAASDAFFKIAPADKVIFQDYKNRGLLFVNAGKDSLAILEFEKASNLSEEAKKDLAGQIGKLYSKAKNYNKTIEYYEYKNSNGTITATECFELGRAYYFGPKNYVMADSSFAKLARLSPTYAPAYFWRGRSNLQLDPKNEKWLSKVHYEKTLENIKVEERAQGNNKNMSLESAQYLGNYYYNSPEKDLVKAKEYFTIVQTLDPNDATAKAFFLKNK
jgi:tetratricopeptide (TPR) repeat protein